MNRQLSIVAGGFCVAGLMLAVASIVALIVTVPDIFTLHQLGTAGHSQNLDIQKYGLVGLLQNGANGVGSVLGFFAGAGSWVLAILSVAFFALLVFAVVVFLAGRGIRRRAGWARIVAGLISLGVLLLFFPALLLALHALRPALGAIAALPIGASLYTLWVLIWRFA